MRKWKILKDLVYIGIGVAIVVLLVQTLCYPDFLDWTIWPTTGVILVPLFLKIGIVFAIAVPLIKIINNHVKSQI